MFRDERDWFPHRIRRWIIYDPRAMQSRNRDQAAHWDRGAFVSALNEPDRLHDMLDEFSAMLRYPAPGDDDGKLPLHLACHYAERPDIVRLVFDKYPDAAFWADNEGLLPLHYACMAGGHVECVRMLVQRHPASICALSKSNNLPLHFALLHNAPLETVILLIRQHGSRRLLTNYCNKSGLFPLYAAVICPAVDNGRNSIVRFVIDHTPKKRFLFREGRGLSPLALAIERDPPHRLEVIESLVTRCPFALRQRTKRGKIPLHLSIEYGVPDDIIEYLIRRGPIDCLYVPSNEGYNALQLSIVRKASLLVVSSILDRCHVEKNRQGANLLQIVDRQERLPLHLAVVHYCSWPVINLIMGAYPEAIRNVDSAGKYPFQYALDSLPYRRTRARSPGPFFAALLEAYAETLQSLDANQQARFDSIRSMATSLDADVTRIPVDVNCELVRLNPTVLFAN